jgi:hypothetical protein
MLPAFVYIASSLRRSVDTAYRRSDISFDRQAGPTLYQLLPLRILIPVYLRSSLWHNFTYFPVNFVKRISISYYNNPIRRIKLIT